MNNWKTTINESQAFLTQVLRDNSAILLFRDDADGCCAAAVLLHMVSSQAAHGSIDFASPEKHSVDLILRLAKQHEPRIQMRNSHTTKREDGFTRCPILLCQS